MKISDREYETIIRELSERIKDVVFMNAERRVRKSLPKRVVERLMEEDSNLPIVVTYNIEFAVGDL